MAATAQLRHTQGVDARGRIRGGADGVGRVTASTRRHLRIIGFLEEATVCRGGVLGHLVHRQRRIVALHELRIAMTVSADPWEVLPRRCTNVSFGGIHSFHAGLLWIPPVTDGATAAPRTYGWCRTRWSCATLAATLQAKHGIEVSAETVRRWLHELGWVWKRAKLVAKDDDPQRMERLARIRFHHENLQAHEVMFFADELDIHLLPKVG